MNLKSSDEYFFFISISDNKKGANQPLAKPVLRLGSIGKLIFFSEFFLVKKNFTFKITVFL